MDYYRKLEFKFRITDLIDPKQDYHLWICSFSLALQDLLKTHKLLFELVDSDKFADFTFYFYKLGLGFVKESMDIIESCLMSSSRDKLNSIEFFKERHQEFFEMINNNQDYSFVKSVMDESRNKVFHYNNFHVRNDAKPIRNILIELEKEKLDTSLVISIDDPFSNDLRFAEDIQVNQLFMILEKRSNDKDISTNLNKISKVMADVISLLCIIIFDFVKENGNKPRIRKISYK
ncbi:hypothetical protein E5161_00035 [Cohnella pontilimi]|uniref:Cthe-2314-like HEPN domain-containing protein n=1 Tax=Cohnella pontilimi TaxID=2564100 RepID=A0A4U0FG29_9BACL|nr:hypothetical protein [Cohnella pontilimi]TJY43841.1 hypothetical protein E5161_00035 [Cohnella pontilimi]